MQVRSGDVGGSAAAEAGSRRLAAIVFADVVGYSALVAADPAQTYQRWTAILADFLRPLTERHRGTIVQVMGDGVLAEFPSALDAVEWALSVQRDIHSYQTGDDNQAPPIALRIAVHVGDVMRAAGGLFGDGVNVAARLQEHAEPGGVILSETVLELLPGTLAAQARDLGFLWLKNVRPVRAYAISSELGATAAPARSARDARPSVAVLPLQNLSGDAADDYFADGIIEDIILSLAGLQELLVISRASTLTYRGGAPEPRHVSRALGVRYVLMGSVRRSSERVRVATQLCDCQTGESLWGDRMEFAPSGLFDAQDRIVERIVAGVAPNVRAAELERAMRKRPESFTAYECTLRALYLITGLDRPSVMRAREFLERATAMDPGFAMPVALMARWHSIRVGQGWTPDPQADAARGLELAAKAIGLDPQNAFALAIYGHLRSYLFHDYDTALAYHARALAAGPSVSAVWLLSSPTLSYVGRGEEAVRNAEHALRLSPFDPGLFFYHTALCLAHYALGAYEEAAKWGTLAESENPAYSGNIRYLAATLAALGRLDEARDAAARLMRLEPEFCLSEYYRTRQPFRDPAIRATHMAQLKEAGLPD